MKRSHRRNPCSSLFSALLALCLIMATCPASGIACSSCSTHASTSTAPTETAASFLEHLAAEQFDRAHELLAPSVARGISHGDLGEVWNQTITAYGRHEGFSKPSIADEMVFVLSHHDHRDSLWRLQITSEGQITGFWYGRGRPSTEETETVTAHDGFPLTVLTELPPDGAAEKVDRVMIFIHGTGPQDYDGTPTGMHRDLARALRTRNWATIRYNKRSFQVGLEAEDNAAFLQTPEFRDFEESFLSYFIADVESVVAYAAERFPTARIVLFGHSQGANHALRVTVQGSPVAGLVLYGLSLHPTNVGVFEQRVLRPMIEFDRLDSDDNGLLTVQEREAAPPWLGINSMMSGLAMDTDAELSRDDFFLGSFVGHLMAHDLALRSKTRQELNLPRPLDDLIDVNVPVLIMSGELDHQVRSYHGRALQLLNETQWKKPNLSFRSYPGLGHVMNRQNRLVDMNYRPVDPEDAAMVARHINAWFSAFKATSDS